MSWLEGLASGTALGCAVPLADRGLPLAALLALVLAIRFLGSWAHRAGIWDSWGIFGLLRTRKGGGRGRSRRSRRRSPDGAHPAVPFWTTGPGAFGVALALALPVAGQWACLRTPHPGPADISSSAPERLAWIEGIVATDPVLANGVWKFVLHARQVDFPQRRSVSGLLAVRLEAAPNPSRDRSTIAADSSSANPAAAPERPHFGQQVEIVGSLSVPGPVRNPGETDFAAYYASHGVFATCRAKRFQPLGSTVPWWHPVALAIRLKERSVQILGAGLSQDSRALMGSLLFGAGAVPVDDTTRQAFSDLGLAHALAASGLQTTLLVRLLVWITGGLRLPPPARAAVAAIAILFFAATCGFAPSIMRATWMSGVALLALATGRRATARRALFLSAIAMLAATPLLIHDMGFQFSVLATWGLLETAPAIHLALGRPGQAIEPPGTTAPAGAPHVFKVAGHKLRSVLAEGLATAIAAFFWCLPLQLQLFGQFSLWSLPANWFAEWLIVALTDIGFIVATLGLLWLPLAWPGRFLIGPLIACLRGGLAWMHSWPGASVHVPTLPTWATVSLYLSMLALLGPSSPGRAARGDGRHAKAGAAPPAPRRRPRVPSGRRWRLLRVPALVTGGGAILSAAYWPPAPALSLWFFDVGQGDAIAIRSPHGAWALVDAGPGGPFAYDAGQGIVVPALWSLGCTHLSLAVLSLPHADHAGGMPAVLASLGADHVWDAGQPYPGSIYQHFLQNALTFGSDLDRVHAGQVAWWDGIRIDVLAPFRPSLFHTRSDPDNNGVVLKLTYGACRILLAADAQAQAEARLVASEGPRLRADVLKVPHHGSRFGSTAAFLAAVRPKASVISVGAHNTYGQPDPGTLRRLLCWGPVYRTDRDGAIRLRTDGHTWSLTSMAEAVAR